MAFTLETVAPWGRSYDEYVRMFHLTETDLRLNILGCGDGPASFNQAMHNRGHSIVSVDPIYQYTAEQLHSRIQATYTEVLTQVNHNMDHYIWETIPSPQALGQLRMTAMQTFLSDFETGKREKRYLTGELPVLSFADGTFDLALCSHLLFLFTQHFSVKFHRQSIIELCRVAKEVRIFPLQDLDGKQSQYVAPLVLEFTAAGYDVAIEQVAYEFQRGANRMLRIRRKATCQTS